MFDIDGTLVKSYDLDSRCFIESVKDVTGIYVDSDWSKYRHVTDSGILEEIIEINGITKNKRVRLEFPDRLELTAHVKRQLYHH